MASLYELDRKYMNEVIWLCLSYISVYNSDSKDNLPQKRCGGKKEEERRRRRKEKLHNLTSSNGDTRRLPCDNIRETLVSIEE